MVGVLRTATLFSLMAALGREVMQVQRGKGASATDGDLAVPLPAWSGLKTE